ncbi:DUF368 domain-containing protein [Streptomonospora sp. PA3]|uniref:DUF368 domain-containing protein n=1 Tax=Streptomonospora sp. PA3 TaxID=2607326 RepID=UPI0012DBFED2|nr:DUF368 domain-containing protein [Streptomonospora sp. PA3]MUL41417.1 DUF368 domain-containing protein [Streptomonospora sp. PA3]
MPTAIGTHLLNGVRGALIGTAEVIPGVSGGTIALITGVYERLMTSAGHVVTGVAVGAADLVRGRGTVRAGREFGRVSWAVVIAVLIGMVLAVVAAARLLEPVVTEHEQQASAVFFGLVLASLWVPYSHSGGGWRIRHYLLAAAAAVAAFLLTGLPATETDPAPLAVSGAAALGVSALVLPGVSGAFTLQALGLYEPTLAAVNDRDFGYLGMFAAGAVIGLALFVKLLQWLLEHHRKITLVVITGVMAGALRALWPWQPWAEESDRSLLAPTTDVASTTALMAAGFALVVVILVVERLLLPTGGDTGTDTDRPESGRRAPRHGSRT